MRFGLLGIYLFLTLACTSSFLKRSPSQETDSGETLMARYWNAVDANDFDGARRAEAEILQTLRYSDDYVLGRDLASGAQTATFSNGVKAIFKEDLQRSNMQSEIDAHRLDVMLRFLLTPPIVKRSLGGREGTIQLFVDQAQIGGVDLRFLHAPYPSEKMYIFDFLLSNLDRNRKNWMVRESGTVVGIDNELIYGSKLFDAVEKIRKYGSQTLRPISAENYFALEDFLERSKNQILSVEPNIGLLRHVFEKAQVLLEYNRDRMLLGGPAKKGEMPSRCMILFMKK